MNSLDVALLVIIGILVLVGLFKGFIRLLVGVAALVVAFVLASRFHARLADYGAGWKISLEARRLGAYLLIFLAVLLVGAVVGWLLRKLAKAAMLGWADRLAGAAVGLVTGLIAGAFVILPIAAYAPHGTRLLEESRLAPYVAAVADMVNVLSPGDLSARYHQGIESLRKRWRGESPLQPPAAEEKGGAKEKERPGAGSDGHTRSSGR